MKAIIAGLLVAAGVVTHLNRLLAGQRSQLDARLVDGLGQAGFLLHHTVIALRIVEEHQRVTALRLLVLRMLIKTSWLLCHPDISTAATRCSGILLIGLELLFLPSAALGS